MSETLVFRQLDSKARLLKPNWCGKDDTPADALRELTTRENRLSVFILADKKDSLERVIAALAAKRDQLSKMDFALLTYDVITKLGLSVNETPGNTPDTEVNRWHRDLSELTASNVEHLAGLLCNTAEVDRFMDKRVLNLLKKAVNVGRFRIKDLKRGVASKVQ